MFWAAVFSALKFLYDKKGTVSAGISVAAASAAIFSANASYTDKSVRDEAKAESERWDEHLKYTDLALKNIDEHFVDIKSDLKHSRSRIDFLYEQKLKEKK